MSRMPRILLFIDADRISRREFETLRRLLRKIEQDSKE
jgi:hypothetical protein